MEQLQNQLLLIEQVIIGGAIAFGLAYLLKEVGVLFTYLKTKTSLIKDEKVRKIVDSTLDAVDKLVIKNITNVDVTLKPVILQSIADGKVTPDEINKLLEIVKNNTIKQLSDDSLKVLNDSLGDVDLYLESTIEDKLATLKIDPTSAVSKTILPEKSVVVVDTSILTNQINQLQSDKDVLIQQISQVTSDKTNVEQANAQLSNQVDSLNAQVSQVEADKKILQDKLSSITNTLTQVVNPTTNIQ
jgi:chaperonin cofactor prefoldin